MSDIYEKQVLTDKFVEVHGAKPDNRVQQQMDAQGAKIKEMTRNSYAQHIRNSATAQMESAYAQHADDPTALDSALKDIRKGTMDEIVDPVVASSFSADFDLKSASLVAKSKERFITRQREDQKSALMGAMDLSAEDMVQSAIGIFETDDADVLAGYAHAKKTMKDAIDATDDRGRNVFSDAERARRTKEISTASITGLKNFLENPNTDPVRIRTVIDRFRKGEYDDMFSTKDYPTAARLLKAADKQLERDGKSGSGGSNSDETTVAGEMYKITLDEYKEDSKDKVYSKATMIDLLDFRERAATDFQLQRISKKEFSDIMGKSAPALVHKIDEYVDSDLSMWHGDSDLQHGIKKLRKFADMNDMSADQRLFLYEGFMREYRAETGAKQGEERFGDEARAVAAKYAEKITQRWIQDRFPGWNPEVAPAIVMGRAVYRAPTSASELYQNKDYQLMELD